MARITKASLEEFAKEVAVLEAAEATILSRKEMERYSGGRYGAYTSLGTSQSDHEAHALAGLEHDLLSTEVGMTKEERGGLYTLSSERPSPSENLGISACSYEPPSGYFDESGVFHPTPNPGENPDTPGFVDDGTFTLDPSGGYGDYDSRFNDPSLRDTSRHPNEYTVGGRIQSHNVTLRTLGAPVVGGLNYGFVFQGWCETSGRLLNISGVAKMVNPKQRYNGDWTQFILIKSEKGEDIIHLRPYPEGSIVAYGDVDLGHAVVDLAKYKGQNISIELHVVFHTNTPKGHVMSGINETIIEGRVSAPKPSKK